MRLALASCLVLPSIAVATAIANPRIDYMLECQGCHLADGAGAPPEVPSLVNRIGRYLQVPGGREYLVQVPGASQSALDDEALAAVLNWMVRTFDPAAMAQEVALFDPREVARYRVTPLLEVRETRERLIARIAALEAEGDPDASE